MCIRIVFSSLIFSVLMMVPMALMGQREMALPNLTVRQQVDLEMTNLARNLRINHDFNAKFAQLEKALLVIRLLRKSNPRQLTDDEIYLDNLVASVSDIPKNADFKVESCPKYEHKLVHQWSPKRGVASEDPSLKKTLEILSSLCAE